MDGYIVTKFFTPHKINQIP